MKKKKNQFQINFKKQTPLFMGIFFVSVLFFWVFFLKENNFTEQKQNEEITVSTSTVQNETSEEPDCIFRQKLNGVCVQNESEINSPVVGIMVENAFDAQPLSGISKASVVYEAPVEANIPRFLALYPLSVEVEKVGPVRSARPYYLDWISEYGDAMYMHVGGSPDALFKIKEYGTFDVNEFYFGKYFWRSNDREAPHNTYTSSKLWSTVHEKNIEKFKNDAYGAWNFEIKKSCAENCVFEFEVAFGGYIVKWVYDKDIRAYKRFLNGKEQRDENGDPYIAKTVLVQKTKMKVLDDIGRREFKTVGTGFAEVFFAGEKKEAKWEKKKRNERTRFFEQKSGSEISLPPGKIWIEIVPE